MIQLHTLHPQHTSEINQLHDQGQQQSSDIKALNRGNKAPSAQHQKISHRHNEFA